MANTEIYNIDNPNNMLFWRKGPHKHHASAYNDEWEDFRKQNPDASKEQILEFGRNLMKAFGL